MRTRFIISLALALSLTAARVAVAEVIPGSRVTIGAWLITAQRDDRTQAFTHCVMNTGYRSGIDLYFGVSNNFTWRIGWRHPEWRLTEGQELTIDFWIDDFPRRRVEARVVPPSMVVAELPATTELFDQFRKGYVLRVIAQAGGTYTFNLTDTHAALTAMLDCVDRHKTVASAPPSPAPPRPPAPPQSAPAKVVRATDAQRLEATKVVANLMATGNIAGFKILSDGEIKALNADVFTHADVVWRAEGVIGTLTIVPRELATSTEQIAAALLADDSKSCKANFASGSMPDDKSPAVKRVFTACAGGVTDYNVRYIIMPVANGLHYVFATLAVGPKAGSSEAVAKTEGLLRQALYEVMNR